MKFLQPAAGTLQDLKFPADQHCDLAGAPGAYLRASCDLLAFADETGRAEQGLDRGDVPVRLFGLVEDPLLQLRDQPDTAGLIQLWNTELERRLGLSQRVAATVEPTQSRAAVMTLAQWALNGRTSREHQANYEYLLTGALRILEESGLGVAAGGVRTHLNGRGLPDWLRTVAQGGLPDRATTAMVDDELKRMRTFSDPSTASGLDKLIADALLKIGALWERALGAMALSHPSDVLAIFHRYTGDGFDDLVGTYLAVSGGAEINVGHLDWVVTRVPSSLRLHLSGGSEGVNGLVLVETYTYAMNADRCALFLRNLLIDLGYPLATSHVKMHHPFAPTYWARDDYSTELRDIEVPSNRFSSLGVGVGLSLDDCARPLRAARNDVDFGAPAASRPRRKSKTP